MEHPIAAIAALCAVRASRWSHGCEEEHVDDAAEGMRHVLRSGATGWIWDGHGHGLGSWEKVETWLILNEHPPPKKNAEDHISLIFAVFL